MKSRTRNIAVAASAALGCLIGGLGAAGPTGAPGSGAPAASAAPIDDANATPTTGDATPILAATPILVATPILAATPPVPDPDAATPPMRDPDAATADGLMAEEACDALTALIAEARSAESATPLTRNPMLDDIAEAGAERMFAVGATTAADLTDWLPDEVASAVNAGKSTSVHDLHALWLESPEHRSAVLGDYTHLGVATVVRNGEALVVEVFADFATPSDPDTKAEDESVAAAGGLAIAPSPMGEAGAAESTDGDDAPDFVPVPRATESAAASAGDGLSSLPSAVLTDSLSAGSASVGARIGMIAVLLVAASIAVSKLVRRIRSNNLT